MSTHIHLRCVCGNAAVVTRAPHDPPNAVECLLNGCPVCNATLGGFEDVHYFDTVGAEISGDPREWPKAPLL